MALKLETVGLIFKNFDLYPLIVVRSNKQQETVSMFEYSLK